MIQQAIFEAVPLRDVKSCCDTAIDNTGCQFDSAVTGNILQK